ncbi:uncharacterized protein LOC6525406 [Drosophila yakuba]|uniref:Putative ionotropic receptor ligand binding domain-containing protein n=1 Tax=Drosophila yakuba TaxID=7245 RepID=B4Q0S8_DROYA|nr:uncharacterized protein LOC6525406 [Drosophila yakuba]EDX02349.1 uncharacterized protein Dyak_GE15732 [Drosophila yakuba]
MLQHLWLLLALRCLAMGALHPPQPEAMTPLVAATLQILAEQVSPSQSTLAVMDLTPDAGHRDHRQEQLMSTILRTMGSEMALRTFQKPPDAIPASYVVFLVNSAQAFNTLSFHFTDVHSTREFSFLILLTRRMSSRAERLQVLRDISRNCVRFHTANVVMLTEKSDGVVLVYGYRMFNMNCDLSVNLELIDVYENGLFRHGHEARSFNRGLSLSGCPLRVSWYPLAPFVFFNGNASDPEERAEIERLSGIDGELIKLLAHIFHFRILLDEPCDKCLSLDIKDDCSGCFDQVIYSNSSILIGAMSGSHQHRSHFSFTSSYHQSSLVFIMHMSSQFGAVAQLVVPFSLPVWLALVASSLLLILVIWLRNRLVCRQTVSTCHALHVLTTLMGNPLEARSLPRSGRSRILYAGWLLLVLVLRVVYQGKLFDSFRLPYHKALPTEISELIRANYTLINQEYLDYYPRELTVLTRNGSKDRFDYIQGSGKEGKFTTTSLIATMASYNMMHWSTSRLTHIKEHIFLYQMVIYLRRYSLLKFAFDRKIKQLLSAGIIGYFVREFDASQYRKPLEEDYEVSPIPLDSFCGLYYVSAIWLSAAVLAFILELLSQRISWLRRFFE